MEVRKTLLGDGDGEGDQTYVAVDLAPLAGQTPTGRGGDVAGKTAPHKPRRNNTTGGEPPEVSNIVKMIKNDFPEFKGHNWAEIACRNISSRALSACLAESQFEGCATQQTLRFRATVLLGGHLFEIHLDCHQRGGD
jgi:hypothetical protein